MSKSKPALPVAPTEDEIRADIARQCSALGINMAESRHDRVFRAVREIVAQEKRQAGTGEISKKCGFDSSYYIAILIRDSRIIRVGLKG